jgi:hypothetical protein
MNGANVSIATSDPDRNFLNSGGAIRPSVCFQAETAAATRAVVKSSSRAGQGRPSR